MGSVLPFDEHHSGFDELYGLELTDVEEHVVRGYVVVRDEIKQPAGLVHGGVYASIAESLASVGTAVAVMPGGQVAIGLSNHTSFLRAIRHGTIHAVASVKHRGRSTWVWEVEMSDDQGRLCVLTRMTVAVRAAPPGVESPRTPDP
ncbi:MAG: PaaI family thioesterase [Solirubrobacteraceae bacterium]